MMLFSSSVSLSSLTDPRKSSQTAGATTSTDSLFADMLAETSTRKLEHAEADDMTPTSSAAQEYQEYMKKPWTERFVENWLKQHGITKEEFEKMSPEEQKNLMDQMKQDMETEMKRRMQETDKTLLGL
jgi:predicted flavoprotein YhiN